MRTLLMPLFSASVLSVFGSISYKPDVPECVLDLTLPRNATNVPTVVWYHGGGLTSGHRHCIDIDTNRIAVAAVEYRLMKTDKSGAAIPNGPVSPAMVLDDCAAAAAWVKRHIAAYGGDPAKVYIAGHSAGGYVTHLLGLDAKWFKPYGLTPFDFAGYLPLSGQATKHFAVRQYFGQGADQLKPIVDDWAPIAHVAKVTPPFCIMLGDRRLEWRMREEESEFMFESLKALGNTNVVFHTYPDTNHGSCYAPAMVEITRYILGAADTCATGNLALASPFADGMVLQRERKVPVWGTAAANADVLVLFAGGQKRTKADATGAWRVDLEPMPASKVPRELIVLSGSSRIVLKDVLVGEVWFCAGQSNMELPLVGSNPRFRDRQGAFVAQWLARKNVRLCYASNYKVSAVEKKRADYPVVWKELSPAALQGKSFSAVGLYFGLELHDALDIPIGLVGTYWGGTRIEPWTPQKGSVTEDARALNNSKPGVLFNEMVAPWCPFAIRGLVWYQGCANAGEYKTYAAKMHALYDGWAKKFENPVLKLYFCQLAPWGYAGIANIQMAQAQFEREEPNAAMAVINDLGNIRDIHPNEKELVGKRLAAHALRRDYGFAIQDNAPTPKELLPFTNGVLKLTFNDAKALYLYNPNYDTYANGFEIAGTNGVFRPATIVNVHRYWVGKAPQRRLHSNGDLEGDFVLLTSPDVKEPTQVRYLHSSPWFGSLYNEVNLPLGAFSLKR